MKFAAFGLLLVAAVVAAEKLRFDGHQVIQVFPSNTRDLESLRTLQDFGFDFWTDAGRVNTATHIRVSPEQKVALLGALDVMGLEHSVYIEDVQKLIDAETINTDTRVMGWDDYQTFETIMQWTQDQAALHPDIISLVDIGSSYEGRPLTVMIINKDPSVPKTKVFIDANIHAREWITNAATTWIFNELLNNPAHASYLDLYEFHYMPVCNPDGYVFSQTNDRMWRKTRSDHDDFFGCRGVDANRNWGFQYNTGGSSSIKCSDTYRGPNAFSEPETLAMSQYIAADTFDVYFTVHSFSQMILVPWGCEFEGSYLPPDFDQLMDVGLAGQAAFAEKYGTEFEAGNTVGMLYVASGGSFDWTKGDQGIKWSYGFELRDRGQNGFILPPDQIIPSGEETFDGFFAMLNRIREMSS